MNNQPRTIDFNPTEWSKEQLDQFLFALMGRLNKHYMIEKPMSKEEIAEYLGVSPRQIDKLVAAKKLTPHRIIDGGFPRFFPSEIKWH